MSFFTPLEGTTLLRCKGIYTEAKLFEHDGKLYAQKGKGFIRLLSHERTSDSSVNWTAIKGIYYREHEGHVFHETNVAKAA